MADAYSKLETWQARLAKARGVTDRVWVDYLDAILAGELWSEDPFEDVTSDAWDVFSDEHPWVARAALEEVSRADGHPAQSADALLTTAIETSEVAIDTTGLERLRSAFQQISAELEIVDPSDTVGLMLREQPDNDYRYAETPANALIFGSTGGDGEHYSMLIIDGQVDDKSPIVLTVPGNDPANTVVGANLRDFLQGGCRLGWFSLWSHFGRRSEDVLAEDSSWLWTDKERVLERLRERLELKEWDHPADHAQHLADTYQSNVVTPYYTDLDYRP